MKITLMIHLYWMYYKLNFQKMIKIYSKIQEGLLLHIIFRFNEFEKINDRMHIIEDNNFLQCSALFMNTGRTFKPHRHRFKEATTISTIAQEAWVVFKGKVKCTFYDINDKKLIDIELHEGDSSFTLFGGHTYLILEDNTKVFEFKTGPYHGQENDKVFID